MNFGCGLDILQRDRDLAAARDCRQRYQDEVEEQLYLVLRKQGTAAAPDEFGLLVRQERRRHRFGVASVDLHAGRAGRAESDAGELQARRGIFRALADEVHGVLVGATFVEQFKPVVDRPDRRNNVVAHTAAQERRQIRRRKRKKFRHLSDYPLQNRQARPRLPMRITSVPPGRQLVYAKPGSGKKFSVSPEPDWACRQRPLIRHLRHA